MIRTAHTKLYNRKPTVPEIQPQSTLYTAIIGNTQHNKPRQVHTHAYATEQRPTLLFLREYYRAQIQRVCRQTVCHRLSSAAQTTAK